MIRRDLDEEARQVVTCWRHTATRLLESSSILLLPPLTWLTKRTPMKIEINPFAGIRKSSRLKGEAGQIQNKHEKKKNKFRNPI
jgi:hypothetical protein